MSENHVYVLYLDSIGGEAYIYGVFSSRGVAEDAREAILKELESSIRGDLDENMRRLAHQLVGSGDEAIRIEERLLRSDFDESVLDELFEDVDGV